MNLKLRRIAMLLCMLVIQISYSQSQKITVTGTVSDASGPLPGVVVLVKNTSIGTQTDFDGNFSIEAIVGAILDISYVGMVSIQKTVQNSSPLQITMEEDTEALEEVVVTAMGLTRKKNDLGYAVEAVKGSELTKTTETNFVNSLSGKVAGVNITQQSGTPGGSSKIVIRGASSLTGSSQPIFIVDGIPISNTSYNSDGITGNADVGNRAGDINPADIESVSVLKGAAAAALYGARAKNGAVIITTKKGKEGQKLKVTISSALTTDNVLKLPTYQNEYAQGALGTYDKDKLNGWGPKISEVQDQTFEDFKGDIVTLKANENNVKNFFETGITKSNSVSIAGGTSDATYRLSYANLNQTGVIPGSQYIRNNFGLNSGFKFSDKFSANTNVSYISSTSNGRPQQGSNDPNVLTSKILGMSRTIDSNDLKNNYVDELGNTIGLTERVNNPYWIINKNPFNIDVERIIGSAELKYKFTDEIALVERIGTDFYNEDRHKRYAKGTLGQLDGQFVNYDIFNQIINNDLYLTLNKKINTDFTVSAILGHNIFQEQWERTTTTATDLTVPDLYNYANAKDNIPTNFSSLKRLIGVYGDITIAYKNLLHLNITGRNDWSSTLPKNNNSYFYPSASISFNFSELMEENEILNFGKLRASYAEVGSDTNPYQLDYTYSPASTYFVQYSLSNNFPHNNVVGYQSPRNLPNSNLMPQSKREFEIGTDLRFFKNRILLDLNYYNSSTTDQIVDIDTPLSTGFYSKTVNVGEIKNSGIEISLEVTPFRSNNFSWIANITYNNNKQEVVSLTEGLPEYNLQSGWSGLQIKAQPGESFGLYGTAWKRNDQGQIIINQTSGLKEVETNQRLGNINPDYIMGFNNNFVYKNFALSFLIDIKKGGTLFSGTVSNLRSNGLTEETLANRGETFVDGGVAEIDNGDGTFTYTENEQPVANMEEYWTHQAGTSNSEGSTFDASYVKLREVSFFYTFPNKYIEKTFLNSVRLGIQGRNLWIIHDNVPHIDPEASFLGSSSIGGGVEFNSVPSTRSIGFNAQLTF